MTTLLERRSWLIFLALMVLLTGLAPAAYAKLKDPEQLVSFLKVELPGWKAKPGYPKLVRMQEKGQSYVEAQVIYTAGKSTLTAVIMDGQTIAEEIAKVRGFKLGDNERGYCRKTTIQGFEAVEIYEKQGKQGFLFIIVGPDCLIPIQVDGVESNKIIKDLVKNIDLPKLAALVN